MVENSNNSWPFIMNASRPNLLRMHAVLRYLFSRPYVYFTLNTNLVIQQIHHVRGFFFFNLLSNNLCEGAEL
jgi:hypothetical protein